MTRPGICLTMFATACGIALASSRTVTAEENRRQSQSVQTPAATGKVVAYERDRSLTLEITRRGNVKTTEFIIVKERTVIDLPPRLSELKPGVLLSVWVDPSQPDVATRIAAAPGAVTNPSMRRPNRRPANPDGPTVESAPRSSPPPLPRTRPLVTGLSPSDIANRVDQEIHGRMRTDQIESAPVCSDAEFVRRVHLDIAGVIPSAGKAAQFLENGDPEKRRLLIDELLASPEYGRHFGELWCDRIVARDLPVNPKPFAEWLADRLNAGFGWDEVVSDLITAEGVFTPIRLRAPGAAHDPAAMFLLANSEDNQPRPDRLAGASASLFLGVQIQCAECHDHPFAKWKQSDFWGMAAFFGRLRSERDQPPTLRWAELPLTSDGLAEITIPSTALRSVGTIVRARFLESDEFHSATEQPLLRRSLAQWMTSPENHLFAQAAVNRLWAHFFGRGLVNPVDDLCDENPASHPAILQLLADEFVKSQFDLKHLARCICLSDTYQRTSLSPGGNLTEVESYACMATKVMPPRVVYDSLIVATGFRELKLGLPATKSKQGVTSVLTPRDAFVDFFRTSDEDSILTEYKYGIPQALKLLNATQFSRITPMVQTLTSRESDAVRVIDGLYLAALSRRPTQHESALIAEFLSRQTSATAEENYNAVLWVLINSGEFVTNH